MDQRFPTILSGFLEDREVRCCFAKFRTCDDVPDVHIFGIPIPKGTGNIYGLLTPHGERSLAAVHLDRTSLGLLTPHGERSRARTWRTASAPRTPNPSWGTVTRVLYLDRGERESIS